MFDPIDFKNKILNAKKGQAIIFDECARGFAAKNTLNVLNKLLSGLMQECGQRNLCIIIVLPSFFLLERYIALWRTRCLFRVYRRRGRKGYWRFISNQHKKFLYLKGKKDFSYHHVKSKHFGRFLNKYTVNEEAYRKKKDLELKKGFEDKKIKQDKYQQQRNLLLYSIKKDNKFNLKDMVEYCSNYGIKLKRALIGRVIKDIEDEKQK